RGEDPQAEQRAGEGGDAAALAQPGDPPDETRAGPTRAVLRPPRQAAGRRGPLRRGALAETRPRAGLRGGALVAARRRRREDAKGGEDGRTPRPPRRRGAPQLSGNLGVAAQ